MKSNRLCGYTPFLFLVVFWLGNPETAAGAEGTSIGRYDSQVMGDLFVLLDSATGRCWVSHALTKGWGDLEFPLEPTVSEKLQPVGRYQLRTQALYGPGLGVSRVAEGGALLIVDTATGKSWRTDLDSSGRRRKPWAEIPPPTVEGKKRSSPD